MTRRKKKKKIVPVGSGGARRAIVTPNRNLFVPGASRAKPVNTSITRERECEGCKTTHTEVWCQHHRRWELQGTEGEAHGAAVG